MKKLLLILAAIAIAMPNAVEARKVTKRGTYNGLKHAVGRSVKKTSKKVGNVLLEDFVADLEKNSGTKIGKKKHLTLEERRAKIEAKKGRKLFQNY